MISCQRSFGCHKLEVSSLLTDQATIYQVLCVIVKTNEKWKHAQTLNVDFFVALTWSRLLAVKFVEI